MTLSRSFSSQTLRSRCGTRPPALVARKNDSSRGDDLSHAQSAVRTRGAKQRSAQSVQKSRHKGIGKNNGAYQHTVTAYTILSASRASRAKSKTSLSAHVQRAGVVVS